MKRRLLAIALVFCCPQLALGQKVRYGQEAEKSKPGVSYPLRVHVSASRIRNLCTGSLLTRIDCSDVLFADVTLDGRKLEFSGQTTIAGQKSVVLLPGDYQARIFKDVQVAGKSAVHQEYEVVLADRTVWHAAVTGASE